jgi:allophanate hydrolase
VPAGACATGRHAGKPFGITFVARAHDDAFLLDLARAWQGEQVIEAPQGHGRANDTVRVAVVGAHLSGEPLNPQLTERGARLVEATVTANAYRLYALPQTHPNAPAKPGLMRVNEGGAAIEVEVWEMPTAAFGSFVAGIPAPLGIGTIELARGATALGFLCESAALAHARDISSYGGWRAWRATRIQQQTQTESAEA